MSTRMRAPAGGMLRAVLSAPINWMGRGGAWGGADLARTGCAVPGVLLSPGPVPTTDYYFADLLKAGWRYIDTRSQAARRDILGGDTGPVIIVRYAPRDWLQLLARLPVANRLVVLFMDDDMPAALDARELPLGYALRTSWRFHATRAVLQRIGAQLWVSTAALAQRYPAARVRPPRYIESGDGSPGEPLDYFYHATAAHRREIEWLLPVVRAVQQRVPQARFDLVADARMARRYADVPGVTVRAPMAWPRYRELPRATRFGLGLAPCLDGRFNRGRAHVKLFEITRFGAAGIYSDRSPYSGVVTHGVNGWLCPDREDAWVDAIVASLTRPGLAAALHAQALAGCRMLLAEEPSVA